MEFISSTQHDEYDRILDEIKNEQENTKTLAREIQMLNDHVIAVKLVRMQQSIKQKIAYVNVKIFNSVLDIYNYIPENELCSVENLDNLMCEDASKYYLVEVILTNTFRSLLFHGQWMLSVSVHTIRSVTSKTIHVNDKINHYIIMPVSESIKECVVEAELYLKLNNIPLLINLAKVNVDISYHFDDIKNVSSLRDSIWKVHNCYKASHDYSPKLPLLEYQILNSFGNEIFIEAVLKNAYHKLNVEHFSGFSNDNKTSFKLKFQTTGNSKTTLLYNRETKVVKIISNLEDLPLLKKYFLKCLKSESIIRLAAGKCTDFSLDSLEEIKKSYKILRNV